LPSLISNFFWPELGSHRKGAVIRFSLLLSFFLFLFSLASFYKLFLFLISCTIYLNFNKLRLANAIIIAIITGFIYQWLERKNYVEHNTNSVQLSEDFSFLGDIKKKFK